ncbi:unnamed protein product [Parnassius apollo]|uniref:(apollo) hypothetical protein n=1 Tax=Parnassius apollo TaxID=110799 RepID=A0A8S3XE64_PARAO|nr:unnamed protein product [Parnassius apollo]
MLSLTLQRPGTGLAPDEHRLNSRRLRVANSASVRRPLFVRAASTIGLHGRRVASTGAMRAQQAARSPSTRRRQFGVDDVRPVYSNRGIP